MWCFLTWSGKGQKQPKLRRESGIERANCRKAFPLCSSPLPRLARKQGNDIGNLKMFNRKLRSLVLKDYGTLLQELSTKAWFSCISFQVRQMRFTIKVYDLSRMDRVCGQRLLGKLADMGTQFLYCIRQFIKINLQMSWWMDGEWMFFFCFLWHHACGSFSVEKNKESWKWQFGRHRALISTSLSLSGIT